MKKVLAGVAVLLITGSGLFAQSLNTLTNKEKKDGWVLLFDGKTTSGWHIYNKADAGKAWEVVDGALQLNPGVEDGGDLTTDKEYENYELAIDWKISEGGNSGIIFDVNEDPKYGASYVTGVEMQVLDDVKADDNKKENHLAGSLYDLVAPSRKANPAGEWNHVIIRKKDGKLTLMLNGTKVVNVQMWGPEWKALVDNSKFKSWESFASYHKGHISLQDHGHTVSYRNIKIRAL